MVRPAGFDPAAYGFEKQDSENLKMSYFQPLDSINFCNVFLVSFGTVWKYLTLTGTIWAQSSFGNQSYVFSWNRPFGCQNHHFKPKKRYYF